MKSWKKNICLMSGASLLPLLAVAVWNSYLADSKTIELIYPPYARILYDTFEFKSDVQVNNLGFRDRDFSVARQTRHRVLALGDSFTFGWGVAGDEAWPKVLERELRAAGQDVEIANLGKPGGSPYDYANIARDAVPLLRPDLIVVGVLQGDDLMQLKTVVEEQPDSEPPEFHDTKPFFLLRKAVNFFVGNLRREYARRALASRSGAGMGLIRENWQSSAKEILAKLDSEQHRRYEHFDETIKDAFARGELNPGLVQQALTTPDYFSRTWKLDSPEVRELVTRMATQFARIKRVAETVSAKVLIESLPLGVYVSRASFENRRRAFGYELHDEMLSGTAMDDAVRLAAEKAHLPFETATIEFRKHGDGGEPLYYPYDGHLTKLGQRLVAKIMAPPVQLLLTQ